MRGARENTQIRQFLVNNDIVAETAIFEALVIQEKRQDNIARIAIEMKYLTVTEMMSIYNQLPDTSYSFTDRAVKLGYLSEQEFQQLLNIQRQTRPRLGEILVEMGKLDRATLEIMLEKYQNLINERSGCAQPADQEFR